MSAGLGDGPILLGPPGSSRSQISCCILTCIFLIAKFRLKLKKLGENTRAFRYDLNQIPYDYTVKVTNKFKGLGMIEYLKNYGWRFVTLYRRQG